MKVLDAYVVYFDPSDHPGKFVVRRQATYDNGAVEPDPYALYVGDDYDDAIAALPEGLTNIGRFSEDVPQILEAWI